MGLPLLEGGREKIALSAGVSSLCWEYYRDSGTCLARGARLALSAGVSPLCWEHYRCSGTWPARGAGKNRIALSAEVSSCSKSNTHTLGTCLVGVREFIGIFATQKVYIKFKSIMSFCLDFLRNWHLYGTSIWESMSSGQTKEIDETSWAQSQYIGWKK